MQECHGFACAAWHFWHEAAERACPHTLKPYATHRAAAAPTQSPTATAKQQLEACAQGACGEGAQDACGELLSGRLNEQNTGQGCLCSMHGPP